MRNNALEQLVISSEKKNVFRREKSPNERLYSENKSVAWVRSWI